MPVMRLNVTKPVSPKPGVVYKGDCEVPVDYARKIIAAGYAEEWTEPVEEDEEVEEEHHVSKSVQHRRRKPKHKDNPTDPDADAE